MKLITSTLSGIIFLLVASMAWSATYYVDRNLTNDCTSGNYSITNRNSSGSDGIAYNTIKKAANVVSPGDTVYVRSGIYNEQITMAVSGTSGKEITFKNYSTEIATVDGTGISDKLINWPGKNYIIWDGIDVRNSGSYGLWVEGSHNTIKNCKIYNNGVGKNRTGLQVIAGDYNNIQNNEIYNNGWNGLSAENCNYTTIEFNDIHDNAYHMGINLFPIQGKGAPMQTGNNVRYNYIHNNAGAGIYTRYQQNFEYICNVIFRNGYTGIKFTYESGYSTSYTCNGVILNNTIADNNEDGIRSQSGNSLTIKNNIIVNSSNYELNIYSGATNGHDFDYNIFYDSSFSNKWGGTNCNSLSSWKSVSGQDVTSIYSDPLFVNSSKGDYTLQPESSAINTGIDLGPSYKYGLDRSSSWPDRVALLDQGSEWDIGAYVYVSGSSAPSLFPPENLRAILVQ